MLNQLSPSYLEAIKREHRTIGEQAHQLEKALRETVLQGWPASSIHDLATRLTALERTLRKHFAKEEDGGFLDEAVSTAPQYRAETSRLLHEHPEILARIREMIARSTDELTANSSLSFPFTKSLEATLRQLLMHETHENALLQKAFNLDSDTI